MNKSFLSMKGVCTMEAKQNDYLIDARCLPVKDIIISERNGKKNYPSL